MSDKKQGWIGVDLDRTLAFYDKWNGPYDIGEPIPAMLNRVKIWLKQGKDVRIFTARISEVGPFASSENEQIIYCIQNWTEKHLGVRLPVTNVKDFFMDELWDDRAIQVIPNEGHTYVDQVKHLEANVGYLKNEVRDLEEIVSNQSDTRLPKPRKVIGYEIIVNDLVYEYSTNERFKSFIKDGYEPFGLPIITNELSIVQAMIKYEEN